jgi:hypothetical protein
MGSPMSARSPKRGSRGNAAPNDPQPGARARFVKTLASVLGVQVITLVLLWLLQSTFSH